MNRIYAEHLDLACSALAADGVKFDVNSGEQILVEDLEAATDALDANGIDYDVL